MLDNQQRDAHLPTIASLGIQPGQRVLLRLDVNVPLAKGKIADDFRLQQALPTIQALLKKRAAVVILGHLGRPDGKRNPKESLKPIAAWFSRKLGRDVKLYDPFTKKKDFDQIQDMKPRSVAVLENLRFYSGEEANEVNFASALACLGDAYVNDAFGTCHRANASIDRLARLLPHAAGPLLHAEVSAMERVTSQPKRPLVALLGGAKISTKLPLLKQLLAHCDRVLVGGAMANTLLAAQGHAVGASPIESKLLPQLRKLVRNHKLLLPLDVVSLCSGKTCKIVRVGKTGRRDLNHDIGPMTVQLFSERIAWARTVVWNGPVGLFEKPEFQTGTYQLAKAIGRCKAFTLAGGGETVQAIQQLKLGKKFSFVSTGGGAMLSLLAGEKLPGLKALGYY